MSGAVERWSAPSGSLSRVVDLVHGTAKWVITVDEEVVLAADYDTALAQRDRARDIAARLEGEVARVRDVVTAWSLGETSRDEMVLWAIREIVGLTPARPETPTPWPHPDAEVAP